MTTPAIERYLALLAAERGCSPRTIASYRIDLAALVALARQARGADDAEPRWSALVQHDLRRWVAAGARAGLSARTIARRLSAWRGFFDWLASCGLASANPARGLRAPRAPRRLPKALAPDQAVSFVQPQSDAGGDDAFASVRDDAIAAWEWFLAWCEAERPHLVLFAGDAFRSPAPAMRDLVAFTDGIDRISEYATVVLLTHDAGRLGMADHLAQTEELEQWQHDEAHQHHGAEGQHQPEQGRAHPGAETAEVFAERHQQEEQHQQPHAVKDPADHAVLVILADEAVQLPDQQLVVRSHGERGARTERANTGVIARKLGRNRVRKAAPGAGSDELGAESDESVSSEIRAPSFEL